MPVSQRSMRATYVRPAAQPAATVKRAGRQILDAEDLRNLSQLRALASWIGKLNTWQAKIEQEFSSLCDESMLLSERLRTLAKRFSTKYPDLELDDAFDALPTNSPKRKRLKHDNKVEQEKKAAAERGADRLIIDRQPDGSAQITVAAPDEVHFKLPRRLVELLEALAKADEHGEDTLIAFKPRSELARRLGCVTEGALVNLVCRLRDRFRQADANDFLIQTNGASYRLAMRRDGQVSVSAN